jgi:hypothetical protein
VTELSDIADVFRYHWQRRHEHPGHRRWVRSLIRIVRSDRERRNA